MIGWTFVSEVMSLLFNILSGFLKLSSKKQEDSRKTSTFASLTMLKPLTVCITIKLWKILKEMGVPDHITCREIKVIPEKHLLLFN